MSAFDAPMMKFLVKSLNWFQTDTLCAVAVEYAKLEPTEAHEMVMDAISLVLSRRLPFDEFRKVMIEVNKAVDERGRIFHNSQVETKGN